MASTNKTPHLGLCQWEATDPFLREDMNGDFARIDEAIGGMSRVKLFDITVTEAVSLVKLDFTEVNLEQFAGLEIHIDSASPSLCIRVNGITDGQYINVSAGSRMIFMSARPGTVIIDISKYAISKHSGNDGSAFMIERQYVPQLSRLDIYPYSSSFSVGDRITVWGVKR